MALESGTRLGPFEIVSLLGKGGRGALYLARSQKRSVTRLLLWTWVALVPASLLAEGISGRWELEVALGSSAGIATYEEHFVLEEEDGQITGTYHGVFGETSVSGSLDGNQVELSVGPSSHFRYVGRVSGEAMEGSCEYRWFSAGPSPTPGSFKGKKVASFGSQPAEIDSLEGGPANLLTAAERWTVGFDRGHAQIGRLSGPLSFIDFSNSDLTEPIWRQLTGDPHRELGTDVAVVASYVEPDDVVIDVGGGAGRVGLPLALRCREVIDVDPSGVAKKVFEEVKAEAGITNARFVLADWMAAEKLEGDVVIALDVIALVRDVVPFIEKLEASARRRVIIQLGNSETFGSPKLFRLLHGEEPERGVGLLPVLWEMGIVPEVRLVPIYFWGKIVPLPKTRERAIQQVLLSRFRGSKEERERVRARLAAEFDEYFEEGADGYRSIGTGLVPVDRHLLITWETVE